MARSTVKHAARPKAPAPRSAAPVATIPDGHRWTFLTNHAHVLVLLAREPALVLREVAARIGITERAVQRIVAELEVAGFLEIEKDGRRNRYRIHGERSLRHPIEAHRTIADLIALADTNPGTMPSPER